MSDYITSQQRNPNLDAANPATQPGIKYLDMQAAGGITKHMGGRQVTDELASLCHIQDAREVLNVGCGIGVSSTYLVKKFGCRVVGVDISEKMIEWSRLRAHEEHVEDKVEFRVADVLDLPFEEGRFDAVIVESVIAFIADKTRALGECIRVTRPGGYVGVSESYSVKSVTPQTAELLQRELGVDLPLLADWQSLWEASGLSDRTLNTYAIDARKEIQSRIQLIGVWWVIRAFARLVRLYLTRPEARRSLKAQFGSTSAVLDCIGCLVFAGRNPSP